MQFVRQIEEILAKRKTAFGKDWRHSSSYPYHCKQPEDNLLPLIYLEDFQEDFLKGAGSELISKDEAPPKFCALISSSALIANTFGIFRRKPYMLRIGIFENFSEMCFEVECPTGLKGTPPTLDMVAKHKEGVLAVESKFTEYSFPKEAKFSHAYDKLVATLCEDKWRKVFEDLKKNPKSYAPLDAAQLVKHYLGLRNTYPSDKVTLLYLYWEPSNAEKIELCVAHRRAIQRFEQATFGTEVKFISMCYPELWDNWIKIPHVQGIIEHSMGLQEYYGMEL